MKKGSQQFPEKRSTGEIMQGDTRAWRLGKGTISGQPGKFEGEKKKPTYLIIMKKKETHSGMNN